MVGMSNLSIITCCDALHSDLLRNFLQRVRHLPLFLRAFPAVIIELEIPTELTTLFAAFLLCIAAELAATQNIPRSDSHSMFATHWEDIAFQGPVHDVPASLIDGKGRLAMITGVLVGLGDDPGWTVGDTL
jgi:hypothetical protein